MIPRSSRSISMATVAALVMRVPCHLAACLFACILLVDPLDRWLQKLYTAHLQLGSGTCNRFGLQK